MMVLPEFAVLGHPNEGKSSVVSTLTEDDRIKVSPVPGASALVAALSVAGLPSDRFIFEGFLPAKSKARREHLQSLASEPRTLIFYESSHRIEEALDDAVAAFGADRPAVMARELTKLFETVLDGTLAQLSERVRADPACPC